MARNSNRPESKVTKPASGSFKEVIEESRQRIQGEGFSEPKLKPRGRGRPPKSEKSEDSVDTPAPEQKTPVAPPPDVTKYLKGPLMAVSRIPAAKHDIPELALSEDEAMICAESLQQVIVAFVPDTNQMDPKTGAVIGALMVFGSIGFQKYAIYQSKKPKKVEPERAPEVQTENAQAQSDGQPAGHYFQTGRS